MIPSMLQQPRRQRKWRLHQAFRAALRLAWTSDRISSQSSIEKIALILTCILPTFFSVSVGLEKPPKIVAKTQTAKPPLSAESLVFARSTFGAQCAVCQGVDGRASEASMNLADQFWRHGEQPADIEKVISEGVPGTPMKGYQDQFTRAQISQLATYVKYLASQMHAKP